MSHIDIQRSREEATDQPSSGGCGCGGHDEALPELDVQTIPHAIRHAAILGSVASLTPGRALALVAPHDPLPLLAQIEQRWPGVFAVDYAERDTAWRLLITRRADSAIGA